MQTLQTQLCIQRITLSSLSRFTNTHASVHSAVHSSMNASIQLVSNTFEKIGVELSVCYLLLHFVFTYSKDWIQEKISS